MNRKIRISLLAFIVLSILGLAVSVFVHYQTQNSYKVTFNEDNKLEVRIDNIHYSGTKQGRVEWELVADSAKRARGVDLTVFSNVTATFYPKGGPAYTLEAREGSYVEAAGVVRVSGDVRLNSKDGFAMRTESLKLMMETKEVTSRDPVRLTSGVMDVEGTGFFADLDTGRLRILRDVRAVIKGSARQAPEAEGLRETSG
ncbi:MAG: LPS export ABC transporter periplasmic protein LptC [Thermodesulfobacteriota bacterium]